MWHSVGTDISEEYAAVVFYHDDEAPTCHSTEHGVLTWNTTTWIFSTLRATNFIETEDGGSRFLLNMRKFLLDYTASHPRRQYSSKTGKIGGTFNMQMKFLDLCI
jgi:hypothetical protein